jgi:ADP-ribose pyrophosphatase YjhB (NUDIX family)
MRRRPPEADCWSIPGGKVEYMERLEDAVVREIEEEVGLHISDLDLLCVTDYMVPEEEAHWVCPTYLARTVNGEPRNNEPEKLGQVAWYPLCDLPHPLTLTTEAALHALRSRRNITSLMTFRSVGHILQELDTHDIEMAAKMTEGQTVRPVEALMVDKRGACDLPDDAVLTFTHPEDDHKGICPGLLRALRPFVLAEALGIPSAEADGYLVSCPGKKGTTWRVRTAG